MMWGLKMIDIENAVVNQITIAVRTQFASVYPDIKVLAVPPAVLEQFPAIVVEMLSDTTVRSTLEFGKTTENHADITFQIDVFCNNGDDRKETAKTIFNFIDNVMQNMGFVRTMAMPTPNIDRTIYRITGRYTGRSDTGTLENISGEDVIEFLIFK